MVRKNKFEKILVLGDVIIDKNSYSRLTGTSAETPTLKGTFINDEISFGGAALVYRNLLELNSNSRMISISSQSIEGKKFSSFLKKNKSFPIISKKNVEVKKRYWINDYKILQINKTHQDKSFIDDETKILKILKSQVKNFDTIIISDYRTGLFTDSLIKEINKIVKENKSKNFYLDSQATSKEPNHFKFKKFKAVFLSKKEYEDLKGFLKINSIKKMMDKLTTDCLIVKNGPYEIKSFFRNSKPISIVPPISKEIDSCGAGDAFIAAFSSFRGDFFEKLRFASEWASGKVEIFGPNPFNLNDFYKKYGIRYTKN